MRESHEYVIVEWIDDLQTVPRYGFATVTHAEELAERVRRLDTFACLESAADEAERLNRSHSPFPGAQH